MAHWYSWFPGDYLRDTGHLSMVEDAAYRRILDTYYMTERVSAIAEVLLRVCRAITPEEQAAVKKVSAEFFEVRDGYLYHEKVEREIALSRTVSDKRRIAGRNGAAKTNSQRAANAAASDAASDAAKGAANAAAIASANPLPLVYTEGKPSVAPSAASPQEFIFKVGKQLLGDNSGSLLGKGRKAVGDAKVTEILAQMAAKQPPHSDPVSYFAAAIKPEARELAL